MVKIGLKRYGKSAKSLLLLHLLQVDDRHGPFGRQLGAFNEHTAILGNGKFSIQSGWKFAGVSTQAWVASGVERAGEAVL